MKEFIERYSGGLSSQRDEELKILERYNKFENRTLIKAVIGQKHHQDYFIEGPTTALRAIFKNWRSEKHFVGQAWATFTTAVIFQHRLGLLTGVYCFSMATFWILSLFRTCNDPKASFIFLLFHFLTAMSAILSFLIHQSKHTSPINQESLSSYIVKGFNNYNFEMVDKARKGFCFECMVVNHTK